MKFNLFSSQPLLPQTGLAIIRIFTGLLMVYHGWEVFDAEKIKMYASWDSLKHLPSPLVWAGFGKAAELVSGILLTIGLYTRFAALLLIGTMLFILFKIGSGKFWYEDQHPFLFVLLGFVFVFLGSGGLSLDNTLEKRNSK